MTGVHLDAVGELEEAAERVVDPLRALRRLDGEIRTGHVADEQRVARQQQPRLVRARAVDHLEAAVLGAVAGCVNTSQHDLTDLDLVAVGEGVVLVLRLRSEVNRDRDAVLESEPTVPRHVIGVGVRLEHAHDLDIAARRFREVLLDRECGIDDDGDTRVLVADEVRSAAEIVVDELGEDHAATVAAPAAFSLEVRLALVRNGSAPQPTDDDDAEGDDADCDRCGNCKAGGTATLGDRAWVDAQLCGPGHGATVGKVLRDREGCLTRLARGAQAKREPTKLARGERAAAPARPVTVDRAVPGGR